MRWLTCGLMAASLMFGSAIQAADLFVTDQFTRSVLRFDATTGAPLGSFGDTNPSVPVFSEVGPTGDIYVGTAAPGPGNSSVLRFNGSTFAPAGAFIPPGGPLSTPTSIIFRPNGEALVTSGIGGAIFRYDATTGAFLGDLVSPNSTAVAFGETVLGPNGNLFTRNELGDVLELNPTSGLIEDSIAGSPGGSGLAFGPNGLLYAPGGPVVWKLDPVTHQNLGNIAAPGLLGQAIDVAFGPDNNLYVLDVGGPGGSRVLRLNGTTGALIDAFVPTGTGGLTSGTSLRFHSTTAPPIPEPATLLLTGLGAILLAAQRKRAPREAR